MNNHLANIGTILTLAVITDLIARPLISYSGDLTDSLFVRRKPVFEASTLTMMIPPVLLYVASVFIVWCFPVSQIDWPGSG